MKAQMFSYIAASAPNLAMVEGVDNEKGFKIWINFSSLYMTRNCKSSAVSNLGRKPLKVLVQVNTSGETSKRIKLGCLNLEFSGLMTVVMPDYTSTPEKALLDCRIAVCKVLGITEP
ncbi:hypothetical protein V2J09_006320 [Rumex salicifolius]